MPGRRLEYLFRPGCVLDLPAGDAERAARHLVARGLLVANEGLSIRCGRIVRRMPAPCPGRVLVPLEMRSDSYDFECPLCRRRIQPLREPSFPSLTLHPDADGILGFMRRLLASPAWQVSEPARGEFRVTARGQHVDVRVCDVAGPLPASRRPTISVVGVNEHLPPEEPRAHVFRLAALALRAEGGLLHKAIHQGLLATGTVDLPIITDPPSAPIVLPAERPAVPRIRQWPDLHVYLVDGTTVALQAGTERPRRYSHVDLGFADTARRVPTAPWSILITLCEHQGALRDWRLLSLDFDVFKRRVSRLRRQLQMLFDLFRDPFRVCSRTDGVVTAFHAHPRPPGDREDGEQ